MITAELHSVDVNWRKLDRTLFVVNNFASLGKGKRSLDKSLLLLLFRTL